MNASDFRIDEPRPIGSGDDAPVRQTLHMRRDAAMKLSNSLREWAAGTPEGGWIEVNVIGNRLIHPALESMVVRGRA